MSSAPSTLGPLYCVIWQSLVLRSYRSMFEHIVQFEAGAEIWWVAPDAFVEGGHQRTRCEPFRANQKHWILRAWSPHVQILWLRGLWRVFWQLRQESRRGRKIVLCCVSEPYALTSFFVWLQYRFWLGPRRAFWVLYAAQNIFKKFQPGIAALERLMLRESRAVLSIGQEQSAVLRQKKYQGPIIRFPLWFARDIFQVRVRAACSEFLQQYDRTWGAAVCARRHVFGYAGKISEPKGVLDLLQAALDFPVDAAQKSALLLIGGNVIPDLETQLTQLRARGWVTHLFAAAPAAHLAYFYGAIDTLVVPSQTFAHWKEQFGRVIVEAHACDCVVLGSDSGAIPEVIADARFIFPERQPQALKQLMLQRVRGELIVEPYVLSQRAHTLYSDRAVAELFSSQMQNILAQQTSV